MKNQPNSLRRRRQGVEIASFIGRVVVLLILIGNDSHAQTYNIIHSFYGDASLGSAPAGRMAQGADGTLYGATKYGGIALSPYGGFGTLFKVRPDGSGFTVLKQFTGLDGAQPEGGLVLSGITLYGTTYSGHTSDYSNTVKGVVYRINTDGSGFTVLKTFTGTGDGAGPVGELLLAGDTLYGVTYGDLGSYPGGYGTIYKIGTDGSGFTTLKTFAPGPDCSPDGGLIMVGNVLYGTASCFPLLGTANYGSVFRINADGTGYQVLHQFTGFPDGLGPIGSLVSSGDALYGTTFYGGNPGSLFGLGVIFKVNVDGSGFTVLKHLTSDCTQPNGTLLLSGDTLYGTAAFGGNDYGGRVFGIKTDGSEFAAFHTFSPPEGFKPVCALILSGNMLYGSTQYGGAGHYAIQAGVLFSLTIPPPEVAIWPPGQTAETGSAPRFHAILATNTLAPTYTWFFNETNSAWGPTTNPACLLPPAQFSDAGAYTVIASNLFGVRTSTPAMLNTIQPVDRRQVPAIQLSGGTAGALAVECTTNFSSDAAWTLMGMTNPTNSSQFYFDLAESLPAQRFYRTRATTSPASATSLSLCFVPAITLTGAPGNNLRLDYINAVGPTDAWVTLDTISLTNHSTLYFDTSSIDQPRRLYRIVPAP